MTKQTYARCTEAMTAAWPSPPQSAATLAVYYVALRELADSTFEAAVAACLKSCKFYPKPAEIFAAARAVLAGAGLLPPTGETAWAEVLQATHRWHPDLGWTGAEGFSSSLVEQAVYALGGMKRVWNAELPDLGFLRKEFLDFYDHKRAMELSHSPYLLSQPLPAPGTAALTEAKL